MAQRWLLTPQSQHVLMCRDCRCLTGRVAVAPHLVAGASSSLPAASQATLLPPLLLPSQTACGTARLSWRLVR